MRRAFAVASPRSATLRALSYEPSVEHLRANKTQRPSVSLRDLVADLGSGYATVFSRLDCDRTHGVELLSQSDMFAAEPQGRVIRLDSMHRPERHRVHRWQVLIAGAGTLAPTELYGRAIIADDRLAGKYVGQDTLALTFAEPEADISLFAYAFLASPTGLQALRSASYGTKILRIRRDTLASLPIPVPDTSTQRRVAGLVRQCVEQREVYLRELRVAHGVIAELPEMHEAHEMCAARRRHAISWRGELTTMSAWTTASTGGALGLLQEKWSRRLGDAIMPRGIYNGPRFARINCSPSHGVEFMSQRDVFLMRPVPRQIAHPGFRDELLFAKEGTLLVGGHGTLGEGEIFGRAISVHGRFTKCAFTQDLLRLVPKPGMSNELHAFLTTRVGMRLLRSTAVGTKILSMRPDLLAKLPLPELNRQQQSAVDQHMNVSNAARQSAEDAEGEAVRIIEEEVLPAWLS